MHKAVFLDRDGIINKKAPEHSYIKAWPDFIILPGVPDAIRRLNNAGYLVLVVTNQRGVARNIMTLSELEELHRKMRGELERLGAIINGIYVCPHDIGQCHCRKPETGLFLQAEHDYAIDKNNSWMVGDSDSDVKAGKMYGVKTIKTSSLPEAIKIILE